MSFFELISTETLIIFSAVIFCAGIIRGTFGFGDGLFVIPIMMNFLEINLIIPTMVWFELVMIFVLVGFRFEEIDKKLQIGLFKWALAGIPLGILFLKWTPEYWLRVGFGPVVLLFAITGLTSLSKRIKINRKFEAFFGFTAGVLAGAYNASGPAVVTYVSRLGFTPQKFVINLQTHFFFSTLILLLGHFMNGLWTAKLLLLLIVGLPVLCLSLNLGKVLRNKIHPEKYSKLIFKLLLVNALFSIMRSV